MLINLVLFSRESNPNPDPVNLRQDLQYLHDLCPGEGGEYDDGQLPKEQHEGAHRVDRSHTQRVRRLKVKVRIFSRFRCLCLDLDPIL